MHKKIKCLIVFLCAVVAVISITVIAALFPSAKLVFSGIEMVYNKTSETTQGFIDVKLEKINASTLSYCIEYDKSMIELSDVATNTPITNPAVGFDVSHAFFKQNVKDFPDGSFTDNQSSAFLATTLGVGYPIIGVLDADSGHAVMNFVPSMKGGSSYIELVEGNRPDVAAIMANKVSGGLTLGRISFKIKDPAAFAKLTESELKNVIKIAPFSTIYNTDSSSIVKNNTGLEMMFINENKTEEWISDTDKAVQYDYNAKPLLKSVTPQATELTVTSYEIYNSGTVSDLFDFLKEKDSFITLAYTDDSEVPAVFDWSASSATVSGTWDPKGGNYTVTQKYNDDFTLSVTVHVLPVSITGYKVDRENETYVAGDPGFPSTYEELHLPTEAEPILSPFIVNGGINKLMITGYTKTTGEGIPSTSLPPELSGGSANSLTMKGMFLTAYDLQLQSNYPWLTVDNTIRPTVVRSVVLTDADAPKTITATASTDTNGVLTIVAASDTPLTASTEFKIMLPGGAILDPTLIASYSQSVNVDGSITITIDPDMDGDDYNQMVAKLINLGSRAGTFSIAAAANSVSPYGDYADCTPAARYNEYLESSYTFDYSDSLSAMMHIKAGATLPTTLTLIYPSDSITTTYNGYDGSEVGNLKTFTVDSWVITGDTTTPGQIIEATGTLSSTNYSNYGYVANGKGSTVTIKYVVIEDTGKNTIDDIPDFVFDTKQVGYQYGDLQTGTFTITNTGATDIYGLSAQISISTETGGGPSTEAFVLSKKPTTILNKSKAVDFEITPRMGLPIGTYKSTVTISSDDGVLDTFDITFTVSAEPTYNIKITVNNKDFGSAKTQSDTYTAYANDTITLVATPEDDCKFKEWKVISGTVTIENTTTDALNITTSTFIMPAESVEIQAVFEETLGAKLRATELEVFDKDTTNEQLYTIKDSKWTATTFAPATREYYATVNNMAMDSSDNQAKLKFKLRSEVSGATVQVTNTHNGTTDTINCPLDGSGYYISDLFDLDESPIDNVVKVKLTYDDPSDSPDEGEVSKEYTIHIFRKLKQSKLATFNYGNSPYGLIMKDSAILSADKDTKKQAFIDDGYQFPVGTAPSGGVENAKYTTKAWHSTNYDLDDYAVFVRNGADFTDPGYSDVKNSIGETVNASDITAKTMVTTLIQTNTGKYGLIADDFLQTQSKSFTLPASGAVTELKDYRIRPDVYSITYTFTDFDGSAMNITKPLIILANIGDYNLYQGATNTDVDMLLHRFGNKMASHITVVDYDVGGKLYKYRICDVDKNGAVNAVDANFIRAGKLVEFYPNT